ncbi:hypothetical protein AAU61_04770 [Desulfocarbo indianensis]|nr:hypothetical protein AAU61_04770 [Desulfocarbo indianensis]
MRDSEPDVFVRTLIKHTLFWVLGVSLLLLVLGQSAWAKGLALGGVASAANLFLMAMMLPRVLGRRRGAAEGMSFLSITVRFALMGGALALAIKSGDKVSVAATAVALFSVQLVMIAERAFMGRVRANAARNG